MSIAPNTPLSLALASSAYRLRGERDDYDALLAHLGDRRIVLIGEATHGTREFYEQRAHITRRLIIERAFDAVAVEADWPGAYRVNRYVRGQSDDRDGDAALGGFKRFPTWMWRNRTVLEFVEWLRAYNDAHPERKAGFYGLDLYSLYTSIEAVLQHLDRVDPEAASRARERYACFERFESDTEQYAYATAFGMAPSCEREVLAQLQELRTRSFAQRPYIDDDERFQVEQNARLVANAEEYYRRMLGGRVSSWNLRDRHMAETLEALDAHLSRERPAKIVIWAHNSHIGDARATEMGAHGEWNIGQLARQRYGGETFLIGMTTYRGRVTAASDWGAPAERKDVLRALRDSYEQAFHQTGLGRFMLKLDDGGEAARALARTRLERAIGVIYLPETERASHYFDAQLPSQFDAVLHFDETDALAPLELATTWETGEAPETYPVGI